MLYFSVESHDRFDTDEGICELFQTDNGYYMFTSDDEEINEMFSNVDCYNDLIIADAPDRSHSVYLTSDYVYEDTHTECDMFVVNVKKVRVVYVECPGEKKIVHYEHFSLVYGN